MHTVKEVLEEFAPTLPPGVNHRIDSNRAEDYDERLSLLTENGLIAIVIVLLILPLFLEYRLAFWVMMGMAISLGFGILFATSIILVIVPCLYMVLEDVTGVKRL